MSSEYVSNIELLNVGQASEGMEGPGFKIN